MGGAAFSGKNKGAADHARANDTPPHSGEGIKQKEWRSPKGASGARAKCPDDFFCFGSKGLIGLRRLT